MPSIRALTSFASNLLTQIPLLSNPHTSPDTSPDLAIYSSWSGFGQASSSFEHSCPADSPLSCHNSTIAPDSCCFIYPGGQLLQTQFWDTSPAIGPSDSWTLHGLWPDLCDGSYPTFCTSAPMYHNITDIIASSPSSSDGTSGQPLLDYMSTYWLPNYGSAEHFWQHEWNKHGTCINTLSPTCYTPSYTPGSEVVDFFSRAVSLFKTLNTYEALKQAGIEPSWRRSYTREEVAGALKKVTGMDVVLGCHGNRLDEVWYSFNVKGSLQEGEFLAAEPVGKGGRKGCPVRGIRYLPK